MKSAFSKLLKTEDLKTPLKKRKKMKTMSCAGSPITVWYMYLSLAKTQNTPYTGGSNLMWNVGNAPPALWSALTRFATQCKDEFCQMERSWLRAMVFHCFLRSQQNPPQSQWQLCLFKPSNINNNNVNMFIKLVFLSLAYCMPLSIFSFPALSPLSRISVVIYL